ncbi:hypothetical protein ATY41_09475 [Leifsonia xyli subsp. xyli]|uniref:Secreted protein n=2 Tax=Leifsonia xyli subsp. xyli TaxID=59736 RepID=Q6ACT8_LEIXX|nr:hypothetical protein [Leifsonia xyli]AAT89805.1 hypothetical protein Lxx21070 [Leifsonia xyli subsp. xyli str. CTCB07]ODA90643.1 hypothetical protein ATY41_09475 [Leifsonia xyli subsp. xyli]
MRLRPVGIAAITLATAITASLFVAAPASAESTTTTQTLVSASCVAQLKNQLASSNKSLSVDQLNSACSGEATTTVSANHRVSADEARKIARERGMNPEETTQLVGRAANGWVGYKDWRSEYKATFLKEYHEGRTYYEYGKAAWVTPNEGYTGRHICRSGGSTHWSFVQVKTTECFQPGPSFEADNSYQFEVHEKILGFSVDYVVGMHTYFDAYGNERVVNYDS